MTSSKTSSSCSLCTNELQSATTAQRPFGPSLPQPTHVCHGLRCCCCRCCCLAVSVPSPSCSSEAGPDGSNLWPATSMLLSLWSCGTVRLRDDVLELPLPWQSSVSLQQHGTVASAREAFTRAFDIGMAGAMLDDAATASNCGSV